MARPAMKTSFDVMNKLFPILNVTTVTSVINGRVCRYRKPDNSRLQDVVILPLSNPNAKAELVQSGTVIVNAFCENHDNGLPNETKLKAIADAIVSVIEAHNATSEYLDLEIINETVFQDLDDPGMSYSSFRVTYTLEK